MARIMVAGAGIAGIWQALTLAKAGHDVCLIEKSSELFTDTASRLGGAMLAPFCESESAEPIIGELGQESARLWREVYPDLKECGTLVLAAPRDMPDLKRFASLTTSYEKLGAKGITDLEPDLGGRYEAALFYASESHMEPAKALPCLADQAEKLGVKIITGQAWDGNLSPDYDHVVDCRGMASYAQLSQMRAVRGEMLVIETDEITLKRPVRLLHPRFPLYIVPWSDNRFMVGATMIESDDNRAATVRSTLDLLGHAYSLHPAFGEARIISIEAGLRPAFADNIPKIVLQGRHIHVNGFYRHGYLLAPVLARLVADYIDGHGTREQIFIEDHGER